jgi:hypothetical protein
MDPWPARIVVLACMLAPWSAVLVHPRAHAGADAGGGAHRLLLHPSGSIAEPTPARACVMVFIVRSYPPFGSIPQPTPARTVIVMFMACSPFIRSGRSPSLRRRGSWSWCSLRALRSAVRVDSPARARADGGRGGHGILLSPEGRYRCRCRRGWRWWSWSAPSAVGIDAAVGAGADRSPGRHGLPPQP